jgi:NADH-quinone oxidoreductase subunit C
MKSVIEDIKAKLSGKGYYNELKFSEITGYDSIEVPLNGILEICADLKEICGFELLTDLFGVDRFTKENRFEIIYNLWSLEKKYRLFLKVKLDSKKPEVESVSNIWSTANWEEREAYDMFGIIFLHHPDLRRIYMRDDFEYYPLRKDYPLMGLPGAVELPKK